MAGIGDLRGRVVITNASQGVLNKVRADMDAVAAASKRLNVSFGQYAANLAKSTQLQMQALKRQVEPASNALRTVGGQVRSVIDQTRGFNEAKFGYGFARITDYIKDGRFQLEAWRRDMDRTAGEARQSARTFGTMPEITMKAREEVEKLGFKGDEAKSIFGAALGLHLSEPTALASGEAAKYMGAVYRAFRAEQEAMAKKLGVDADDPKFVENYVKGMAAKAAVAGAESALGPADLVEGMRQFAPQWAAMGMSYSDSLGFLAHLSNYGFRAPEIGTAAKSMMTKITNPTAKGLRVLNSLGINRADFMTASIADPEKATNQLNNLLSGSLFSGKGGKERKAQIREMLDTGQRMGVTQTPEFQQELTNEVMRMLPKGWEGRIGDVQKAVNNATISAQGGVKLFDLIKTMRDRGATVGQIAEAFEGRHVARYTPAFQQYQRLVELASKIDRAEAPVMDAVVEGRKKSEAGKTDQVFGSWQDLMIRFEQMGGIIDRLKSAVIGFNQAATDASTGQVLGTAAALGGGYAAWRALRGAGAAGAAGTAAGAAAGGAVAGAAAAGAARAGILRRIGGKLMRFVPGLGWVALGAGVIGAGVGAYEGYKETGTVGGALRGAVGIGNAKAGESGDYSRSPMAQSLGIDHIGEGEAARASAQTGQIDLGSAFTEAAAAVRAGAGEQTSAWAEAAAMIRAGGNEAAQALQDAANAIRNAASQISSSASSLGAATLNTGRAMGSAAP